MGAFRHGQSIAGAVTPEYRAWSAMFRRFMPSYHDQEAYAGRGLTISPVFRGRGGFEKFFAEVGPRPSPTHSLDRIDNERGYEPGNLRWATKKEQANNRRWRRWKHRPR
jgi:hypothetical protein